ncbi:hypothetical protein GCM10027093_42020 [Paraburkholderia jirisanensis]
MAQTKLTAHLPTVDVEITRRDLPEQNAQAVTIHITATPSFDAAANWLMQPQWFMPLSMFPAPLMMWADMMRVWQPWLPSFAPVFALPRPD